MSFACQQATMVNTKIIEESNVAFSEASTDASRTISVSIKFNEDHSLTKIIMCINLILKAIIFLLARKI